MSFGAPLLQCYHMRAVKAEAQPKAKQKEEQGAEHNSSKVEETPGHQKKTQQQPEKRREKGDVSILFGIFK